MNQKVVFFEGPSCAGKSTTVNVLLSKYPNVFHVNKDKIKWLISDYTSQNDKQRSMLKQMLLNLTETAIDNGLSVFIEGQRQLVDEILKFTQGNDIDIKYVNIEAPYNVLLERFKNRVEQARSQGTNISNTSEEGLKKWHNKYLGNKHANGITLDTSKLSVDEVVNEIEKYIN